MHQKVSIYIEIEKDSNIKYELNKETNQLEVDRILPDPYYYPHCYGFIENTLAPDEDELDALIITDKKIEKDRFYDVYIIGILLMRDEKGTDDKVICVLEEDYKKLNDIDKLSNEVRENIHWFFSNYKSNTPNKWSKVYGFEEKEIAIHIYNKCKIQD
jgi:inorganic pyrophosphatase